MMLAIALICAWLIVGMAVFALLVVGPFIIELSIGHHPWWFAPACLASFVAIVLPAFLSCLFVALYVFTVIAGYPAPWEWR